MGIETRLTDEELNELEVELPRAVWELKLISILKLLPFSSVELPRAVWELKLRV